ncbi:MAG TPA: hypothetical protein VFP45_05480 [Candidatus Nitrosotalea sp.]|nr:hypothetical protein [Candidatus Nitrosotalea sp.]
MPDDSCRTCGGELMKWSTCSDCKKITQRLCRKCNLKTVEDFHSHISLESYKILETRNTIATVQSYSNLKNAQKPRKDPLNVKQISRILVVSGIVMGIIVLGMSGISYLSPSYVHVSTEPKTTSTPTSQNVVQTVKEAPHVNILSSNDDIKPTYSNCLGNANGISLTITCPTTYGYVYKAIVGIPSGLISQFENKVFNLRELSIIEHVNSITIQYEKRNYEAKFVNS